MTPRRCVATRWLPHAAACLTTLIGAHCSAFAADAASRVSPQFDCVIEPYQVVRLASQVVGVVARLDVDRGDVVKQGQVVGNLEDGVEAAALELAKARAANEHTIKSIEARLNFLRRKLNRLDELHRKAVSSLASFEEAEAEVNVAEQQLREAQVSKELARLQMQHSEEVLNQRKIRSPINGIVVERLLGPGEYRNEQTPILTLAQTDLLRVEVFVPTAYYGQIERGGSADVVAEMPGNDQLKATVSVVDRVMDAASGTFGVRLLLPNREMQLPAGVRCKISFSFIATDERSAAASASSK
jgi:RND family efflux transporter MFP subunit